MKGSQAQPDDVSQLSVTIGGGGVAAHNRLHQNEQATEAFIKACSHDTRGQEQKKHSKRGLALFSIPVHNIFENYCSSAWEPGSDCHPQQREHVS